MQNKKVIVCDDIVTARKKVYEHLLKNNNSVTKKLKGVANIDQEYELIQRKESHLSANMRKLVVVFCKYVEASYEFKTVAEAGIALSGDTKD